MVDINIDSHFGAIIIRLQNLFSATLSRIRTEIELFRVKSH